MIFEQYLVIDYGTSYIKGVLFKQVLGAVSVLRSESLKLVRFESDEGDEYEYNIVRFIQSFFPEESSFIINLPADRLFIRDIIVPLGTEKAVREVIPFEVENIVPFPIEDMVVQGSIWKVEADSSRVITFSSHYSDVERFARPFSRSDVSLKNVSTDNFTLSASCRFFYGKTIHEPFAGQLDIGGKICIFNLLMKGALTHSRYFSGGGDSVTENIRKLLKLGLEDAEELKHSIRFSIIDPSPEETAEFKKQFHLNDSHIEAILGYIKDTLKETVQEFFKSIHTLHGSEKPAFILLSGGGSLFKDTEKYLSDLTGIQFKRYDFLENNDEVFINCLSMGYHYRLPAKDQINFLTPEFSRKLNKNAFRLSNFKVHISLSAAAFFILSTVFITGIFIDRKKIDANHSVLSQRYKEGFGKELGEDDDPIEKALSEVKTEQKKSEIVRLFLSKDSILDLIHEMTMLFPAKEEFNFVMDNFIYDGTEIQIQGKVDSYIDAENLKEALAKSKKFKNFKLDKNLIPNVPKLGVNIRLKMELVSGSQEKPNEKNKKGDGGGSAE